MARLSLSVGAACLVLVGMSQGAGIMLPSGGQIAFISGRDGDSGSADYEIYLMDVTRNLAMQVTNNEVDDLYPAWSPDGCCLAFASRLSTGLYGIFEHNLLTGETRQVTDLSNVSAIMPHWSPDGKRLVIQVSPGQQSRTATCFLNLASTELHCVAGGFGASWSPHSDMVASYVMEANGQFALRLIDAADYFETRLVQNLGGHVGVRPVWSPDGSQIAYSCNDDICVINADGGDPRQLITLSGSELNMDWSPDGRMLVFDSRNLSNVEIFAYAFEERTIRRLTFNEAADGTPIWRP
jgi:Tol biopolymer transport system component